MQENLFVLDSYTVCEEYISDSRMIKIPAREW